MQPLRMKTIALATTVLLGCLYGAPASAMDICSGGFRAARKVTCLVDGDTGWENGKKWRLLDIDTPEISKPGCADELAKGKEAMIRLQELMTHNEYGFVYDGREDRSKRLLVRVILSDGRDAGEVLLAEKLAQPWPNSGNVWCER
ncbi:thermonuclease family protein [Phyllobacterium sp. UNC302MFCol5.2]|uniref:thermonuclease family protein n=1 Tax=Phyllobacterium sp. UNC302MFCol5.2 TaxID=1449065 RepID=UPI0006916D59|nr:thermonuclease family protein [Phyllobacterium sp. UNC302MFCol5.2]